MKDESNGLALGRGKSRLEDGVRLGMDAVAGGENSGTGNRFLYECEFWNHIGVCVRLVEVDRMYGSLRGQTLVDHEV